MGAVDTKLRRAVLLFVLSLTAAQPQPGVPAVSFSAPANASAAYHPLTFNNKQDLFVISIATVSKPDLIEAQQATFGRHLPVVHYTENDFPKGCVFCQHKTYHLYPALYHNFRARFEDRPLGCTIGTIVAWQLPGSYKFDADIGKCGFFGLRRVLRQQRTLQALRKALQDHFPPGSTVPRWTMIVDDDTFVDPWELVSMLNKRNHTELVYLGNHAGVDAGVVTFTMGGAGTIISRALMKSLLEPLHTHTPSFNAATGQWELGPSLNDTKLDSCIARQLGGSWCHKHSDWALAVCLKIAGAAHPTLVPAVHMTQLACQEPNITAGPTGQATCHYAAANMQHKMYNAASTWHGA